MRSLGVLGVATGGAGFLVEAGVAATVLSATSVVAGASAAYLDTGPCLHGDRAACIGAGLGFGATFAGVPTTVGLALGVDEGTTAGSILYGLFPGLALNLGLGATTADSALWLAYQLGGCISK
jgi:hypothetical protein